MVAEVDGKEIEIDPHESMTAYAQVGGEAAKRFATTPQVRAMFGLRASDPQDPEYRAAMNRYVSASIKQHNDEQAAAAQSR